MMRTVILFVLAVALSACGDDQRRGTVVGRWHRDAFTTTTLISVGRTLIPQTTHYPARFCLIVRDAEGSETSEFLRDVSREQYENPPYGVEWPIPSEIDR